MVATMKKLISLLWLFLLATLHAADVTAHLSGNTVPAGQGVMLTLTVEGGSPDRQPVIPEVKDLIVNPRGSSKQIQMINGHVTRSIAFSFVVGSNKAGDYEIPAITVRVGSKDYTTQPLHLKVGASPNAAPAGMDEEAKPETPGKYGHLSFQMMAKDRKYVYPGEIAPVKIQAYFPADAQVSLNSMPRPEGSAFTLHNLSKKPNQATEVIDGKRYLVVTWFGGLSATKAGEYPASFKLTGTVAVRDDSAGRRRPPGFGDPIFGGSMLDDFFAPMVQKDVELITDNPAQLEVRELPKEGRPKSFTGAIGNFEFQSADIPKSLKTGEPCQIESVVNGAGNFSLLSAPQPFPLNDWKTYKGSENFEPEDAASFGGTKTFRYNAVPMVPGEKQVGLTFSYFDPEKGEYRELKSSTGKVVISGELMKTDKFSIAKEPKTPRAVVPQLAPIATDLGTLTAYHPLSIHNWFTPVVGACGILSLAIFATGLWKDRGVDPVKEARQANRLAVRKAVDAAEEAVARGDALAFFLNAKNALQLRIAERESMKPQSVTLADLDVKDEAIADILAEADRLEYSGVTPSDENLNLWKVKLEESLARLETEEKEEAT